MAQNNPYIGKIKNNGAQAVTVSVNKDTAQNKVKNGGDLRTGSGKGSK